MGQICDKFQDRSKKGRRRTSAKYIKFGRPIVILIRSFRRPVDLWKFLWYRKGNKQWRQKQIRKITDKVFDHVKNQTGRATLSFEDLYIAVLIVYNDINKHLPGPHFDPPSKDTVKALMQECDINLDGELDREEFVKFMQQLTADTFSVVSQGLIITLLVAPTVALATKRATEGVPGVGKVVQKLPNSIYASLITLAIVTLQATSQGY